MAEDLAAADPKHVVLVVSDDTSIRQTLCGFLASCGFTVLDVNSAEEAIALIENTEILDAVFRDIRTSSNIDGLKLTKWILQNRPDLPIILESGDLGDGALTTPYALDQLAEKIRQTILNCGHKPTAEPH